MVQKAIVLLSGGMDSTTCLAIAKEQGFDCYALSFIYGQRSRQEVTAAELIAKSSHVVKHNVIRLDTDNFMGSALTDKDIDIPKNQHSDEIPITYVPARNTVFLSIALGWAEVVGAYDIFYGANIVDYSGYPDCRPEYISAFEKLANLATKIGVEGRKIHIHAPLLYLSKKEIILQGKALGVDYSKTISCYDVDINSAACGKCDSCLLRSKGFLEAGVEDPTPYQTRVSIDAQYELDYQ